jgi:hypothetical protein
MLLKPADEDQTRLPSLSEIDGPIASSTSPKIVANCKSFREQFQEGDEVLALCTSTASWQAMSGRAGYYLRRNGENIAMIITMLN